MSRYLVLLLVAAFGLALGPACNGGTDDDDSGASDDDDTTSDDDDATDDDDTTTDDDDAADDDDSGASDDDDSGASDDDDTTTDDDDTTTDDDDTTTDDDDTTTDDDDTTTDDDDSAAAPCTGPENIVVNVELIDPTGAASTTLSATSALIISVEVENLGGVATPHWFNNGCLVTWSLTSSTGQVVDYGPMCTSVLMQRTFTCPVPTLGSGYVDAWDESQVALAPGTYDLVVGVGPFPDTNIALTVP